MDTVYIETTIPSYCVSRPSRNIIQLARQELTKEWWEFHRGSYRLFASQVVLEEAGEGEAFMAAERLKLLSGIPLLEIDEEVANLADELISRRILPAFASQDALHIAVAAAHGMHFLLTWNCKHIANPHIRERIREMFSFHGLKLPVICTPEEFIGDDNNSER